jgi:hypothetical protein
LVRQENNNNNQNPESLWKSDSNMDDVYVPDINRYPLSIDKATPEIPKENSVDMNAW